MNSEKNADSRGKAQKVLQKSEQQGRNEFAIDYDERNPFRSLLLHSFSDAIVMHLLTNFIIRLQHRLQ